VTTTVTPRRHQDAATTRARAGTFEPRQLWLSLPGAVRKLRAVLDWTVGLPFRRDTAEVGSIGHPRPLRAEEYERGGTHRPIG